MKVTVADPLVPAKRGPRSRSWIPACAGMSGNRIAQVGTTIHFFSSSRTSEVMSVPLTNKFNGLHYFSHTGVSLGVTVGVTIGGPLASVRSSALYDQPANSDSPAPISESPRPAVTSVPRCFPPPLCRGIGRLLCRDGQCRRVARTSYDVRLSLRARGMRTNPKRILIFAFTAAVVMAMVPDARPQDADQARLSFC